MSKQEWIKVVPLGTCQICSAHHAYLLWYFNVRTKKLIGLCVTCAADFGKDVRNCRCELCDTNMRKANEFAAANGWKKNKGE